jgi:hypothetical protein
MQKYPSINSDEFCAVITSVGPAGSGSESRRAKMTYKNIKSYEISLLKK